MNRLIDRRIELETSEALLRLKLKTLEERREQHEQRVSKTKNYHSKRALLAIDKLESEIKERSKLIAEKLIILNSLIQKARI